MVVVIVGGQHQLIFFVAAGAVGPNITAAVLIQQSKKHLGVVDFCEGDIVVEDHLVFNINMVFVAGVLFAVILGPARLHIFLPLDVEIRLKTFGNLALFDLGVLFAAVALDRGADQAGVDDLTLRALKPFYFSFRSKP